MNPVVLLGFFLGLATAGATPAGGGPDRTGKAPALAGVVMDEQSGRALAGVVVRLEVEGWPRAWAETDASGRYAFQDWLPVQPRTASGEPAIAHGLTVVVRAMHPQYGTSAKWIHPACGAPYASSPPGCTQNLDFSLRIMSPTLERGGAACTLEGRVIVDDRPGERAEVVFETGEVEAVADAEGRFRVEGVAPGLRTVWVRRLAALSHERVVWVGCEDGSEPIWLGFELREHPLQ